MSIDVTKYVGQNGGPAFFNTSGAPDLQGNNLWGGQNIFVEPVIVPMATGLNQAPTFGQVTTLVQSTIADTVTQEELVVALEAYAPLAGATFTGPVMLSADPTQPMQAVTMQYVLAQTVEGVQVNKNNTFETGFTQTFDGPVVVTNATTAQNPLTLGQFQTDIAAYAPLASPTFTGIVTVPLPATNDNSLQPAPTEWVNSAITAAAFNPSAAHTWGSGQVFATQPTVTTPDVGTPASNELATYGQVSAAVTAATTGMITSASNVTWTGAHVFNNAAGVVFNGGGVIANDDVNVKAAAKLHFDAGSFIQGSATVGPLMTEAFAAPGGQLQFKDSGGSTWVNIDSRGGTFSGAISGPDGVTASNYATVGQVGTQIGTSLAAYAPLASPIFAGTPQGPQPPTTGQNLAQLATVGYVNSMSTGQFNPATSYEITGNWTFDNAIVIANGTANNQAVNLGQLNSAVAPLATTAQLASYAPLAGAAFTGAVTNSSTFAATGGFTGPVVIPNGGTLSFYTGSTSSGASKFQIVSGQLTLTMPTANNTLAVYSNGGTQLGTVMYNPMTNPGDMIIGGTAGTPTKVAVGTAGQVWTVNAGATSAGWASPAGSPYVVTTFTGTSYPTPSSVNCIAIGSGMITGTGGNNIFLGATISDSGNGNNNILIGQTANSQSTNTVGNAVAIGNSATVGNSGAIALGYLSLASATDTIAIGHTAKANGLNAVAIGTNTIVAANGSAIGYGALANAQSATAIGHSSNASGNSAVVVGDSGLATSYSVAVGTSSNASFSSYAIAIGYSSSASGAGAVSVGNATQCQGTSSIAVGQNAHAGGNTAVSVGNLAVASDTNTIAIGSTASSSVAGGIAVGSASNISATNAIAIGINAASSSASAVAVGDTAQGVGTNSVAIGNTALASNTGAIGIGYLSNASATNSVALGSNSVASVANTVAIGASTTSTRSIVNMTPGVALTDGATIQNVGSIKALNQHGTAYTLALTDFGCWIAATAAFTLTIPTNATVPFPVNTIIWVSGAGGVVTLAAASGVTLSGFTATSGSNNKIALIKTGTDAWTAL